MNLDQKDFQIKGIFVIHIIKEIRARGSDDDLVRLKEKIGSLNISPIKNYPISTQIEAEKILCEILYGRFNSETAYKFGKEYYKIFLGSQVGKIFKSLFQENTDKIMRNLEKVYQVISSSFKVEVKRLADKKYSVRMFNDPYPLRGSEGVLAGGMEFTGADYEIEFINHGHQDHEFIVSWK